MRAAAGAARAAGPRAALRAQSRQWGGARNEQHGCGGGGWLDNPGFSLPESVYRRPEHSSWAHRSVQDWKPMIAKVAHLGGRYIAPNGSDTPILHMTLIDHYGYRWPVRFVLQPGMTIHDVVTETDMDWFDLVPQHQDGTGINWFWNGCNYHEPDAARCHKCVVSLPYEYLDAMHPPECWEIDWMVHKMRYFHVFIEANCRIACQVLIEDWMDGMTICLPQVDSMAQQMYISHGWDKESGDLAMSMGPEFSQNMVKRHSKREWSGYLNNPAMAVPASNQQHRPPGGLDTAWPEHVLQGGQWRDELIGSGAHGFGGTQDVNVYSGMSASTHSKGFAGASGGVAGAFRKPRLKDIFWMDFIDDVIREVDPKHEGRYRFMRQ